MSEYTDVEKPLLNQLASMGWQVIEQASGIPKDPAKSLRTSFREVVIKDCFVQAVRAINLHQGVPWLTDEQLEGLYEDFTDFGERDLLASNQVFIERLNKWQVDENVITREQNPVVKVIDFDNWQANRFIAINQYRVDTPGAESVKQCIIPDVVLLVNGLPLVVIECKDVNSFTSEPMHQAVEQLRRYADLREPEGSTLKEGEPKLFYTNQLMVATFGDDCKFGSITSTEEYYFNWKTIYPDVLPYVDEAPDTVIREHRKQEQLVQGMLRPERLLDITRSFTLFMDAGKQRIKVISRYQQYRAVDKIIKRIEQGDTAEDRSGVVWHTQGSGKSLTMVFLVRKMRTLEGLKDFKVLMVNDRKDLDKQLGETVALTGETVYRINSSDEVKTQLCDDSSNLNMVMIHKFREADDRNTPDYLADALANEVTELRAVAEPKAHYGSKNVAVLFESFGEVNASDKILIMIDEAHRTQSSGQDKTSLSDNMFDAFPNATRLAFTGTPLIADHHDDPTWKRFGGSSKNGPDGLYIDEYKLQDAVDDGATLQILYEGKTADTAIYDKHGFDTKFEDLFKDRSDNELAAIRKKYGATGDILEAEERIEEIATDLVKHYAEKILPSGYKAQVVCSSKQAALHYQTYIRKAIKRWVADELAKPEAERDQELLAQVEFIDVQVIISSDGTNEKAAFVAARNEAKAKGAVENFKKKFDSEKPETGVALLVVCDMLLTGFDAPIEQVMYIDKRLKEHNLLQAIARVNRTYPGKTVGYVVDYIGLTENLKDALSLYSGKDRQDILDTFKSVESEKPVLDSRFNQLIQLFEDKGIAQIEALVRQQIGSARERYEVTEAAIQALEDVKTRDSFNVYLKKFMQSMDIILPNKLADTYKIPMYQFSHLQAKARERYKDDSINIAGAGEKVRKLVNEHLISLGINPKVPPVELFSDKFIVELNKQEDPRAAASEMEHAIRKHCKISEADDPVLYKRFSEKLEEVLKKYNDNWDQMLLELGSLRDEIDRGRGDDPAMEDPFSDLIVAIAFGGECTAGELASVTAVVDDIMDTLAESIDTLNFWDRPAQVTTLEGKLNKLFVLSKLKALIASRAQLTTEVMDLAKRREADILANAKTSEVTD